MSDSEPVIELVPKKPEPDPKNPFSWKIVAAFIGAWIVVIGLVAFLKIGMIRLLLPLIGFIFLVYLVSCTIYLIKNRK